MSKPSTSPNAPEAPLPDTGPAPREVELKLFVPPHAVDALRSHPLIAALAIGPPRVQRIDNRYYDTDARELAAGRMGLRLRRIGPRWLQTLKVSGGEAGALSSRDEWEMPVAGPALALAKFAGTPLAVFGPARTLARRLKPVFTTNFRREARMLALADGSTVEFAIDVGVICAGRGRTKRTVPISEVEIELKGEGDVRAALLQFAAKLARDVPLVPLAASKASRGYRLADQTETVPAKVVLPAPSAEDRSRAHLGRVVAAARTALLENAHVLLDAAGDDREFVHQARVAVRRLRSALRTFGPVAGGRRVDALDDGLRVVGRAFGEARDWDVFTSETVERLAVIIGDDAEGIEALAVLSTQAEDRRAAAHRALMQFLESPAFGSTAIAVERTILRLAADGRKKGDDRLADNGPRWLAAQQRRVIDRSRRIAVLDAEERHGLRIEVKRLRYALDLVAGLYDPDEVDAYLDALSALQEELGTLNDAVVADALLAALPPSDARERVRARFESWLSRRTRKRLPKIAALAVGLELTPQPWRRASP